MDARFKKVNPSTLRILRLRKEQDVINRDLAKLLRRRLKISHEILKIKLNLSVHLHDDTREKEITSKVLRGRRDPILRGHLLRCFQFFCDDSRRSFTQKQNSKAKTAAKLI